MKKEIGGPDTFYCCIDEREICPFQLVTGKCTYPDICEFQDFEYNGNIKIKHLEGEK